MKPIFHAPEIIILVFQSSSAVGDGLSLASTCKFLASVWRMHTAAILYRLLEAKTPAFNQALLAVRATNLVCDACRANKSPPRPFPLHELGVQVRKPDIGELKQVQDLQHLARCVEHMHFRGNHHDQMHRLDDYDLPEEEGIRLVYRFHCAMYRVLFAGAVLAQAYLEPLFLAPCQAPPRLLHRLTTLRVDEEQDLDGLTQQDIEYLERFPVYNLEAGQERWEPAFGALATWLLDDMESTFTKVEPPRSSIRFQGMRAEELGRLQEVTFFLAAYHLITDKLFNKDRCNPDADDLDMVPPPFPGRVRKVPVVMFGIFRPEEVSMPESVEDSSSCYLVNEPLMPKEQETLTPVNQDRQALDCPSPWAADVWWALDILHRQSGRPNLRNGRPSPTPPLRFIEFILAQFFNQRFQDGLFDEESPHDHMQDYQLGFLSDPGLFRDGSITFTTWLFARDQAQSLGYRRLW
ncbi:uncharacterized protein B0H64DRAFT_360747 [Chaetomium fimeti]|uniref:Uncharacterized protein n=1 Tax=Chaetomium fimeti TaxID=1854472 RepID=A0AAE0HH42_9PEZI|nr:hypothetical protein B0H64DRAFT_360747 [Chaetomium fimeti]